eukprot:3500748-Pyramimonas_sp.AAC.1
MGAHLNWACNPGAFVYATCKKSGPFRSLMRHQLQKHPCSSAVPWKVIIYVDGISPRDPLAKGKDHRGMDAVHWSFAEFDEHLQNEDLWFTLSTARVAKVKDMLGCPGTSGNLSA